MELYPLSWSNSFITGRFFFPTLMVISPELLTGGCFLSQPSGLFCYALSRVIPILHQPPGPHTSTTHTHTHTQKKPSGQAMGCCSMNIASEIKKQKGNKTSEQNNLLFTVLTTCGFSMLVQNILILNNQCYVEVLPTNTLKKWFLTVICILSIIQHNKKKENANSYE